MAVPPTGVTETSLAPTVPAGIVAVTKVLDTRTTLVAFTVPNFTTGIPVSPKPRPSMVTAVPPCVQSTAGVTFVISSGVGTK